MWTFTNPALMDPKKPRIHEDSPLADASMTE